MSGHSKWSTIKRKKEKTDNARAKVFTKIGREIAVAVKAGGPDPAGNSKLKDVIAKAKAANMPNDNIERVIKKAAGEGSGENYDEIVYEGYGPSGIAIIVETLTDNKNRTAADVRSVLTKGGGNLGATGSVSHLFKRKGVIAFDASKYSEDDIFSVALEAGADDVSTEDGTIEVITAPEDAVDPFPVRMVIPAGVRRRYAAFIASMVFLIPNIVCLVINLIFNFWFFGFFFRFICFFFHFRFFNQ